MGSCVSVHKNSQQESAMKLRLSFGSKTDELVIPPSPIKDKPINGDRTINDFALKSHSATTFRDYGSKEETFFDSKAYLESDCEDDFFSVNGDFTPSRGNTPIHHSFAMGTPRINKASSEDRTTGSIPEPSPTEEKKKKLFELFSESIKEDQDVDEKNASGNRNIANGKVEVKPTIPDVLPTSTNGTPYVSGRTSVCSSERTANGDAMLWKEKSLRSVQCCLPSLVSCRSFSDRKKKTSSAIAVNDTP